MVMLPDGFVGGDSIHVSESDPSPHLSGRIDGAQCHVPYYGQTTLPMFSGDLRADGGLHRAGEIDLPDSRLGEPIFRR